MPTFTGTAGSDTLTGTATADTLISNGGSDTINAGDGDDTVIVVAQLTGYGTLNGGNGIDTLQLDRALAPVNALGGGGPYALSLAIFNNTALTTLTSFERLTFNSLAGDRISAQFAFGGNGGSANQIGTGLAATAEIVGGAGADEVTLLFNTANLPGTVTAPSFTFTNWETATRAYLGDRVTIVATGNGDATLNGSAHSAGVQGLVGGGGNDIINGSSGMDMLGGGAGGNDQLFGNGGDDTLFLINTYLITPSGTINPESTRTGAGSLFDGGADTDFLLLGGNVNFQGTIQNIEGLVLIPGYTNTNAGATLAVGSQYATVVTFSNATFAAFPTNLQVGGQGQVDITLGAAGDTFNGAAFQFDLGSDVVFNIISSAGSDTVTGTSSRDILEASGGSDTLNGLGGDDVLWLYAAAASAQGGADDDTFHLFTNGGGSAIDGGADFDTLIVEQNTTLSGPVAGLEAIHLIGTQLIMNGTTFKNGFTANATITGAGTVVVAMVAGTEFKGQNLIMNTGSVAFVVLGTTGVDVVKGVINAVNIIIGGDSTDQLRGGALNDTINGEGGNDKIVGFTGADTLTGGAGADQFRYLFATDSGVGGLADHITDFVAGADRLNFSLLDADPVAPGRQALTFIDTAAFSATGTAQVRYGVSGANLLVQVDLDGNGTADMEIVLDNAAAQTLTSGDFML
jgi:Ca2+-binding RTX toxin-like protein